MDDNLEDMSSEQRIERRRHGFRRYYRWVFPMIRKSLGAAILVWMTTMVGAVGAIVYGCITGPARLNAQSKDINALRQQVTQSSRERTDTRDFIYWLASKECARIPASQLSYGVDADACGRVAQRSGGLFSPPDSTDK
jgi:hypothetical protein